MQKKYSVRKLADAGVRNFYAYESICDNSIKVKIAFSPVSENASGPRKEAELRLIGCNFIQFYTLGILGRSSHIHLHVVLNKINF